jgi:hypothetical protein
MIPGAFIFAELSANAFLYFLALCDIRGASAAQERVSESSNVNLCWREGRNFTRELVQSEIFYKRMDENGAL